MRPAGQQAQRQPLVLDRRGISQIICWSVEPCRQLAYLFRKTFSVPKDPQIFPVCLVWAGSASIITQVTEFKLEPSFPSERSQWRASLVQLIAVSLIALLLYSLPLVVPFQAALSSTSSVGDWEALGTVFTTIGASVLDGGVDTFSVVVTLLAGLYVLVAGGQLSGSLAIPKVQRILATAAISLVGFLFPALLFSCIAVLNQPAELGKFMLVAPLGAVVVVLATLLGEFVVYTSQEQLRANMAAVARSESLIQGIATKREVMVTSGVVAVSWVQAIGQANIWRRRLRIVFASSLLATLASAVIAGALLAIQYLNSQIYFQFWMNSNLVVLLAGFILSVVVAMLSGESARERWASDTSFSKYVTRVAMGAVLFLILAFGFLLGMSLAENHGWLVGSVFIVTACGPSLFISISTLLPNSRIGLVGMRQAELDLESRVRSGRAKIAILERDLEERAASSSDLRESFLRRVFRSFGYQKVDSRSNERR